MKHIMIISCFLSCSLLNVMERAEARPELLVNYSPELRGHYSLYDDKDAADYYKFRKKGCIEESLGSMAHDVNLTKKKPQTILLISVSNCNEGHVGFNKSNYILVYKNKHRIARFPTPYLTSIDAVTDINQDGLNELILSGGFTNMGTTEISAEMVQYHDEKLKRIKHFQNVYSDDCGTGNADSKVKADQLFYDRKTATFSKERSVYACSKEH